MTTTTPETPQDHLQTQEQRFDAELQNDELLADLPPVKPPHKLRIRQQNSAIALAFDLEEMMAKYEDPDLSTLDLDGLRALADKKGFAFTSDADAEALIDILTPTDYAAFDKPALVALAVERGLEHNSKTSKDDLIELLEESDPQSKVDRAMLRDMLDFAARIDEWAEETIATNEELYVEWAEGKGHEVFFSLLTKYAAALGK